MHIRKTNGKSPGRSSSQTATGAKFKIYRCKDSHLFKIYKIMEKFLSTLGARIERIAALVVCDYTGDAYRRVICNALFGGSWENNANKISDLLDAELHNQALDIMKRINGRN